MSGRKLFARRHRRELRRTEVEDRLVVSIRFADSLALIDLRDDGVARIGAPNALAREGNHAAGRTLLAAVYVYVPEVDGFPFSSSFTGGTCVVVFGRTLSRP